MITSRVPPSPAGLILSPLPHPARASCLLACSSVRSLALRALWLSNKTFRRSPPPSPNWETSLDYDSCLCLYSIGRRLTLRARVYAHRKGRDDRCNGTYLPLAGWVLSLSLALSIPAILFFLCSRLQIALALRSSSALDHDRNLWLLLADGSASFVTACMHCLLES